MIKLKSLIVENLESEKEELLKAFPGEYYEIFNAGYGDGHSNGPFDAFDALNAYLKENPKESGDYPWGGHITLLQRFKSAMKHRSVGMRGPMNYISDEPMDFSGPAGDI